jgi:hypothetical protein
VGLQRKAPTLKFHRQQLLGAALLSLAAAVAVPQSQSQAAETAPKVQQPNPIDKLSWLAGSWSGEMWGGRFEAYYSTPEGGKILSHSKLFTDGQEAFFEFELFEQAADMVSLTPFPGGKRADGFELESYDREQRLAVFENPDKDYPTRITYQRVSEDRLEIVLSDPHGGTEKSDRFSLERD